MSVVLEIQTSTDEPFYTQITTLSGTAYVFSFEYRARLRRWALTLSLADGTPLIQSIALVTGCDLLDGYRYLENCPPGSLVVAPFGRDDSTPDIDELGIGLRCELLYEDPLQ